MKGLDEQGDVIEQLGDVMLDGVRRPYREGRTTSWKLQHVIKTLQDDCQWNLEQFMVAWVACDDAFTDSTEARAIKDSIFGLLVYCSGTNKPHYVSA